MIGGKFSLILSPFCPWVIGNFQPRFRSVPILFWMEYHSRCFIGVHFLVLEEFCMQLMKTGIFQFRCLRWISWLRLWCTWFRKKYRIARYTEWSEPVNWLGQVVVAGRQSRMFTWPKIRFKSCYRRALIGSLIISQLRSENNFTTSASYLCHDVC